MGFLLFGHEAQKVANAFCVIQLKKLTQFNKKVENLN